MPDGSQEGELVMTIPEAPRWSEKNLTREAQFLGHVLLAEPRYVALLIGSVFEAMLEMRP
jgi:hypothetical protein